MDKQQKARAWQLITSAVKEGDNKQSFYFLKHLRQCERGEIDYLQMMQNNRYIIKKAW
jgi:hypothetical protein